MSYDVYVYLSLVVTGLNAKSSAEIWMLTVAAACFGVTIVHVVVLLHVAATMIVPTLAMSAPAIGRKPVPVTVTVVPPAVLPVFGAMAVTVVDVSFVAYHRHMAAASPG